MKVPVDENDLHAYLDGAQRWQPVGCDCYPYTASSSTLDLKQVTSDFDIMVKFHVDADVDIRVDNGVIRNERELCPKGRETNGRVAGRLGLGGKLIKLRTSNGSISVH